MTSPSPDYREIPLTRGQVAIVDPLDYEWLCRFNWYAYWNSHTHTFYAVRHGRLGSKKIKIFMHREILGLEYGDRLVGDHKDSNGLHNFRSNLRVVTYLQSSMNTRTHRDNPSMRKGVTYQKARNKWRSRIMVDGVGIDLYYGDSFEEAVAARVEAERKYQGEFANNL